MTTGKKLSSHKVQLKNVLHTLCFCRSIGLTSQSALKKGHIMLTRSFIPAAVISLVLAASSHAQSFQGLGFFLNGSTSFANGLSPDGCTVVGFGDISGGGGLQGFRWTASGGMLSIGYFPNPGSIPWSRAQAISGRSAVIVGFSAK